MDVVPKTSETDPNHIGVHVQDEEGVCISLGECDEWHHLSWTAAEALYRSLAIALEPHLMKG
jgi:hypothetical protein